MVESFHSNSSEWAETRHIIKSPRRASSHAPARWTQQDPGFRVPRVKATGERVLTSENLPGPSKTTCTGLEQGVAREPASARFSGRKHAEAFPSLSRPPVRGPFRLQANTHRKARPPRGDSYRRRLTETGPSLTKNAAAPTAAPSRITNATNTR